MNFETVNELITSLESAGELSTKERKYLEALKEFRLCSVSLDVAVKVANDFDRVIMECRKITGCPAGVDLQDWVKQLAAENVGLKAAFSPEEIPAEAVDAFMDTAVMDHDWNDTSEWSWVENETEVIRAVLDALKPETPATDRIYAGAKADGRAEGINFAASRLAAAFNHGHVDKSMAEVGDVVRMILTAKEDLANDPAPPADGLSGEYAEKSLAEWEAALREGADK